MRVETAEKVNQLCNHAGPPGLVTRSQTCAVIAVEILVELDVILPLGIGLEFLYLSVNRSPARRIAQEDPRQPIGNFSRYLKEVHQIARSRWTLDFEVVSVIEIERQEGADEQRIHRHPYGTTPVRISAKHTGVGFGRQIVHAVFLAFDIDDIGMFVVKSRQCADSVRTEEFFFIEHAS